MSVAPLEFEQPLVELDQKIQALQAIHDDSELDIAEEIARLHRKSNAIMKSIYARLTPWQVVQVSRHPDRPHTLDYIQGLLTDFEELHGDRKFADDPAIMGGLGRFLGQSVMVIGHQKGRDVNEKIRRNFGMPKPEGYRKALRLMQLAEKFSIPILTFIDTPGAYPGIGAEERGQSEAIGKNLYEMSRLKVPIICTVIGEGGSGGALAIAVGDIVNMLQYAVYSVISPEGCASILWKTADKAPDAAKALGLTARELKSLKLIDCVVEEPLGGAHRDPTKILGDLKMVLEDELKALLALPLDQLLARRFDRLMSYGTVKRARR